MAAKRSSTAGSTPAVDDAPKVLAVRTPSGKLVRLQTDLPAGVVIDIAAKHDLSWAVVVNNPLFTGSGAVALDVYTAACAQIGDTVPDPLPMQKLYDAFDLVADDAPEMFDDGTPTGGAAATT